MGNIGGDDPVIITCALTGGIHGKEANSNLPEQPDEIVESRGSQLGARAQLCSTYTRATPTAPIPWTKPYTASCTSACAPKPTRSFS